MARNRFGDVKRGALLNAAYSKYIERISNPNRGDPNSRGERPPREIVGLTPYGIGKVADPLIMSTRRREQSLAPTAIFTAATKSKVVEGPDGAVRLRGFTPAQVTLQQGSRNATVDTSKFTGLRYLKYTGLQKFVSPFGRNVDTDLEFEARDAIRNKFLSGNNSAIKRVSFRAESRDEYVDY